MMTPSFPPPAQTSKWWYWQLTQWISSNHNVGVPVLMNEIRHLGLGWCRPCQQQPQRLSFCWQPLKFRHFWVPAMNTCFVACRLWRRVSNGWEFLPVPTSTYMCCMCHKLHHVSWFLPGLARVRPPQSGGGGVYIEGHWVSNAGVWHEWGSPGSLHCPGVGAVSAWCAIPWYIDVIIDSQLTCMRTCRCIYIYKYIYIYIYVYIYIFIYTDYDIVCDVLFHAG